MVPEVGRVVLANTCSVDAVLDSSAAYNVKLGMNLTNSLVILVYNTGN